MKFKFLDDEVDGVINLINDCFNLKASVDNFELLSNQRFLLLLDKNEVIGTCLITLKNDPIKNTKTFYLDYVCIKDSYQNKGLGSKMFEQVLKIGEEEKVDFIELTSSKKRVNARKMYLKYGMEIKDTDIFIKKI